jgi:hypothetical protein
MESRGGAVQVGPLFLLRLICAVLVCTSECGAPQPNGEVAAKMAADEKVAEEVSKAEHLEE